MSTYDNSGVRFKFPSDWALSEDEDETGQTMVHIQSPGTAFWSLTVSPGQAEPESLFTAVSEALGSEYGTVDEYTPEVVDPIGGHPAVSRTFEFVVHELPAIAEARVVWFASEAGRDRTALVLFQYAETEQEEIEPLLERMTGTLEVDALSS